MKMYVVRTHENHWECDCIVAKFLYLKDALNYVEDNIRGKVTDCLSISEEEERR